MGVSVGEEGRKMYISVTPSAIQWFLEEWGIQPGDTMRIYVRYGGSTSEHPSFSLALNKASPNHIGLSTQAQGILFFIEESDIWYLNGKNLMIDYHQQADDIVFAFS